MRQASSAQAATMVQQKVKRVREEAQAGIKREEALRRKKKRSGSHSSSGHFTSVKKTPGANGFGNDDFWIADVRKCVGNDDFWIADEKIGVRNHGSWKGSEKKGVRNDDFWKADEKKGERNDDFRTVVRNDDFRIVDEKKGVSNIDSRTQLLERARYEIKKKLHQWSSGTVVNSQANTKEKEKLHDSVNVDFKMNTIEPLVMDVPDPDFHNFDRQRCQTSFKEGQIWAAYDDDDGMPRHYAMIHKVTSVDPFKIKVCWLNSRTNNELGILSEKAFGEFKLGKHENVTVLNIFSHKVNFAKSENGCYEIYPRKGEVWALYRNWSPEWNDETSNEVKHKYEIVEVDVSDDDTGFTVTPLVKVAGFKTVFRRNLNPEEERVFPKSEISRFSHQIPWHFLTGRGSVNAIKGCLDLDPAAIPDEFLQVIAVVQDLENMDDEDDDDLIAKDSVLTSNCEPQVLADVNEQFI